MSTKIGLNLTRLYSINFSLPKRKKNLIKFIIIHYTGMKNESKAIERLCSENSKVSSHYFIKNNGEIINLVPDLYEAWHAGKSSWKKLKFLNKYSIGIEISNPGHQYNYRKFNSKQISSVIKLLVFLKKKHKIISKNIIGHSDIAPNRKKDPGEKFPWKKLAKRKLSLWHNLSEIKIKKYRKIKLNKIEEKMFLRNLVNIGYSKLKRMNLKLEKLNLVKAFQRRFRQELVNGVIDKECLLISKNLLKY